MITKDKPEPITMRHHYEKVIRNMESIEDPAGDLNDSGIDLTPTQEINPPLSLCSGDKLNWKPTDEPHHQPDTTESRYQDVSSALSEFGF